ncbi:M48 family peptidase [Roseovarius faecimaris]|uniref:M48 family peptidase n=1 Tax=Roseovarius faecimaris TaxID=2494550 RepID=A0A6I6IVK6_9RHOB|nr:SprT family zinc-dependent metalloprotease [Roseovarius faecimaris]QGX99671.1 M48 family peptidase [Roseovarius faecimaris]
MGQHILPGNPPLAVTLRQSARARRISLRVSGLDGKVTLTIPRGVREGEALDFAREKEAWLRTQLSQRAAPILVGEGVSLPVDGIPRRIVMAGGRTVRLTGDEVLVGGAPDTAGARLQAWLKQRARGRLAAASDVYAAELGVRFDRLTLRDTRSRWGSCSARGGLMYSWRLVLAPPEVLDYVAAHEVAHLREMNHSPAFWSVVAQLCPGYEAPRRWLRENGAALHRYRFGN